MKEKGECFPDPILNTPIGLYSRHGHTPEEEGGVSFTDCTVVDDRPASSQPSVTRRASAALSLGRLVTDSECVWAASVAAGVRRREPASSARALPAEQGPGTVDGREREQRGRPRAVEERVRGGCEGGGNHQPQRELRARARAVTLRAFGAC